MKNNSASFLTKVALQTNGRGGLQMGLLLLLAGTVGTSGLRAAVTITSPTNGSVLASPVQLSATSSQAQGGSFLVYDNGSLVLQESNVSSVTTSLTLTAGAHTIMVQETTNARYGRRSTTSTASTAITVSTPVTTGGSGNIGAEIAADMTGSNEGHPEGVPLSYDWANGPVMVMGNNASGWQAMTAWGLVYAGAQGNPATNTRVNIRDMQTWFLSKSKGTWTMLQNTSTPDGDAYVDDFSGDSNKPADVRQEPDGTISVTAGGGYNFHFYPDARASINPNDIGGFVTIFQARLIVGNPALPDDRNSAVYLASSGGDYYPALTGGWPANLGSANPGIASGKMKYVQTYWRFYSMTTLTAAQLQQNPPPINLTGIQP